MLLTNPRQLQPPQLPQAVKPVHLPTKEPIEAFKVGDLVYHIDRPSYALTITQIVNDELIKAVTIGWKGAELFAISELVLIEETAIAS